MPNKTPNRKALSVFASLYDKQVEIMEHFIADKGMSCRSDVIRQALNYFHDAMYPNYIFHKTPAAKIKQKKLDREDEFESEPDDVFASDSLHAYVVTNEDGIGYALFQALGHSIITTPLEGIKQWAEDNSLVIDFHKQNVKEESWESLLSRRIIQEELARYKITNLSV